MISKKSQITHTQKRRQLLHQSPYVNVMNLHQGFESFEKIKLSIWLACIHLTITFVSNF
jgi:hypothetical protein